MFKGLYTFFFIVLTAFTASAQNRFSEGETAEESAFVGSSQPNSGPGDNNPGGDLEDDDPLPAPIDDYLPVLGLAGAGIILWTHYRRRTVTK